MTTPQPNEFDASSAGGSKLVGGNSLQQAIDNLTAAVGKNTQAVTQAAGSPPGGTPTPVGNTGQSVTYGSFPRMAPALSGFQGSGAGSPANYATTPTGGNGNGSGGWGQAQASPGSTLQQAGSSFMSSAQSALTPSGPQFSNQVLMNQFATMSTLGMQGGATSGNMAAMYNQAFGRYGSNLNAIAFNAADAAQGYSTLQSVSGQPNVMGNSLGQAAFSGYAGIGYANPSLGAAGSAAAAQQLYSPTTSLAMRALGYSATPMAGMGQANPTQMGQLAQSMFQRWYGKSSVSSSTLNAGLANGQSGALNLQAILGPNAVQTYGPMLQMYNKLFQQGVGASQANTMLSDASHNANYNGQSAQKLLADKYGIGTSDIQKLKDTTAVGTSNTSGEMGGFDSSLSAATTTIQKFDTAIGKLLKDTGLGTLVGASHGFIGSLGSVGGAFGALMSKGVGMGMGMLSGILGGAGGTPMSSGSSGTGSPNSTTASVSGAARTAIKDAESQLGKPYVWGGDSPSTGFDCSGLVEWAYQQAGIRLPRTSQAQWAALQSKSVPLNKVMAGDIVFSAGSDGTANSPGHEALMISNNAIIEAPYTGADIRIRSYNQGEWQHAGRPTGNLNASGGAGGGTSGNNGTGLASTTVGQGNGGLGLAVGNYGSSSELDNIASSLLGGSQTGAGGFGTLGGYSVGNGQGSGSSITSSGPTTMGGQQAEAIAKKLAAAYGWGSGTQWNDLVQLWMDESGWRTNAENASGAYGIPQALPGSKMASAGSDWRTNPATQIKWGLGYIKDRWHSPSAALANENAVGWYADGTNSARAGMALLGERGPELVSLTGGQQIMDASKTASMLKGTNAKMQSAASVATIKDLYLASQPQNYGQTGFAGKCEVSLNMPPGAIVIHSTGTASDASNNVRTIMQGVTEAMADNEMVQQIMAGVMG